MKHIYITFIALGLSLPAAFAQKQTPPPPAPAPIINIGEAESFTLKNGLKVYVVENHKVPTVSISLILDNDPLIQGDKNGYVDLAGSLLRTGTKTRTKEQLDEEIDFIGAELATFGGGLNATALKKHLPKLFQLTSDVLLNPQFKQEELDKLKTQSLSGLASAKANPNQVESMVRNTLVFGKNHPYGEQPTEKTVENITLTDVQNYYNNYFRPNVGYLAIVGDVNTKEIKKLVKKYFGPWKKGNVPEQTVPAPAPITGTRIAIVDRPGSVQSVLSFSNIADLKPGSSDAIPATVMNSILGGPYSRLMNNLREKRAYTYGAYSQLSPDEHISQFNAFTSVRTAVTDSAVAQMILELYRMRAGEPTPDELQRAQSMVSGAFARSLESPQTVALFAINTARYKLPKDYYANYLKNVAAVTPATVKQVAEKYITPTNAYILAVGNADYIERRLARFDADGTLEYYDVNGNKVDRASLEVPAGMTAQKVLDQYIQALGGRANLEKVKDVTITSTITSPAASLTMTQIQKGTDKIYQSLKYGSNEVQRTVINGAKGKAQSADQNRNLSAQEIQEQKLKLALTSIISLDKFGIKKNLLGMERINGRAAYRLELTMPNGKRTIYYIDSESGLKLREMEIEETNIGNATQTTDYGDYREVNGIKIPHRSILHAGQQGVLTEVQKVEINNNVKDDAFKI
ncbi:insulinase family protein [Adhaeribacter rhizoryzae]|uniref:Insulinase family protein n=1 Tax=Adhaeribacter rhizoryzae TaxID=2607907 RepID=A0A5M6D3Q7_9BACT|nr:insulinase family protein [Adhaeribacter rhizoryzae]KAA5539815.1 insulinase family protein [Adhaeribacter rhizoryzae]